MGLQDIGGHKRQRSRVALAAPAAVHDGGGQLAQIDMDRQQEGSSCSSNRTGSELSLPEPFGSTTAVDEADGRRRRGIPGSGESGCGGMVGG